MTDNRIGVLDMIAADMKIDAAKFDGKPFNGRTVAEYFGNQGAAIAALANILSSILKEEQMKIYVIGNSLAPTTRRMEHIASNLNTKFNKAAKIEINSWAYKTGNKKTTYGLYMDNFRCTQHFVSWPDLITYYRKLMKGEISAN